MLKNAYLDAKIGFDPAENEPPKECRAARAVRSKGEVEVFGCTVVMIPTGLAICKTLRM